MKALNLDKLDAFMEIEYDGEIYNAYTKNDINDKAIKAIPLDKVKKAREEIENEVKFWSEPPKAKLLPSVKALRDGKANSYKHCLEILDKLIESERNE